MRLLWTWCESRLRFPEFNQGVESIQMQDMDTTLFTPLKTEEIMEWIAIPHLPGKDEIRKWFSKVPEERRKVLLRFALDVHKDQIRALTGNIEVLYDLDRERRRKLAIEKLV